MLKYAKNIVYLMSELFIDVIIPCYNAADTIERAVMSVLSQSNLGRVYLIDDGSVDETWQVITRLQESHPNLIHIEKLPVNKGVATARNWGAMLAKSDFIAFLDADDSHQSQVLSACAMVFSQFDVGMIRLPMTPINLPKEFADHPEFDIAWRTFEMTAGSNMMFYRPYFLALGGFDDDEIFKKFGGEDGALGLATIDTSMIATLFDNPDFEVGVNYHCHQDMFANHLFHALLFGENTRSVTQDDIEKANQSTQNAINRIEKLRKIINAKTGKMPIILS